MIKVDIKLHKAGFSLAAAFSLPSTGVTGIYGPSGCGKTSLLRSLAGLEPDMTGSVELNGERWHSAEASLPIEKRRIGIVFQETSLFSHLSVEGNLRFAQRRAAPGTQTYSLPQVAQLLQIQGLLERRTDKLSGGERQRVAIGRALMAAPQLLVMDEPLSALDLDARQHLMHILEKVFQELEIPVLYVSHASDEIARLADNLVVLEAGEVTAYGPIKEVLGQVDSPLSRADDAFCVLQCRVSAHDRPHLSSVISSGGAVLYIPRVDLTTASAVRLRIRARDVSLCLERPQRSSILNILEARVVQISECLEQGSRTLKLDLRGEVLLARVSEYSVAQLGLQPGQELYAQIKSASLVT